MTMMRPWIATAALLGLITAPAAARPARFWTASWAASPAPPLTSSDKAPADALSRAFRHQTVSQTLRLSTGGTGLRVRLTNEYGGKPLAIGTARIVLIDEAGADVPGTRRLLTFGGRQEATIPAGSPWFSDPVDMPIPSRARLRISLYLPEDTGLCTCHPTGSDTTTISPPGDFTDRPFQPEGSFVARAFVSEVDVASDAPRPAIVTFGDSITDGFLSSNGKDRRWPDRLAERLAADPAFRGYGVANAALSGNRVLSDGFITAFGASGIARFDRDVLAMPGVRTVILLEGVNDIGQATDTPPTAAALIAGYRQIIARAHAKGIRIVGGTLLPYEGAGYHRPAGEAVRVAVNRWILTSGEFDATVDFDKVMRDPAHPSRLRADYQSGDWLHPNDAGYRAMGDAVPLAVLR
jgi:lysophospholipase L1-like esterase